MDALISNFRPETYTAIEDIADKASYKVSVAVITFCFSFVSINTFFWSSIDCYLPVYTKGKSMLEFMENYCWVHGTIALPFNFTLPEGKNPWRNLDKIYRISYYQWVPFVLGLQGILYYVPRLVWMCLVPYITGNDLEGLITSAKTASNKIAEDRKNDVNDIAECLKDTFFLNERSVKRNRIKIFQSGNMLFITYFIIKLGYLANAIGQLYIMQCFLGFGSQKLSSNFGWKLLTDILYGEHWQETAMFPRMSYCYIGNLKLVGTRNQYLAQCVLPINMINEKIYIFLWFWTIGIITLTVGSIPLWLWRMCTMKERRVFIKRYLKSELSMQNNISGDIGQFINSFLDNDGVFILRIMSLNAGELITGEMVVALWNIYQNERKNPRFNDDVIDDDDDDDRKELINMEKIPHASNTDNPVFV